MAISKGFAPLFNADARVLVLGSMPGKASLVAQEYYAHPRNAFWKILYALDDTALTVFPPSRYENKCALLNHFNIALWDVLARCEREGSLDASIDTASEQANDFSTLIKSLPKLERILFNGKKAEQCFRKHVQKGLSEVVTTLDLRGLPSTSPANAAMPYEEKCELWHEALSLGSQERRT